MNETTGGSGDGSGDGKAQSRRPKWVAWLVGGVVIVLVVGGVLGSYMNPFTVNEIRYNFDRLDHVETDPAVAASFKKEYEQEWERDYGKPYTPQGRETYEDDEVGVIVNLEPSLEPTRLPEDDCTPIREMTDDTVSAAPTPTRGDSGEVTAAPAVGPAEMDCD